MAFRRSFTSNNNWYGSTGEHHVILDIGCGGGQTINRLAAIAVSGRLHGVDYSTASVATALGVNQAAVHAGQVQIHLASVSSLPFEQATFDLVTAVETHYNWPDRAKDLSEVCRVLRPGGQIIVVAEAYRGRSFDAVYAMSMKLLRGTYLSPSEHRTWFEEAGLSNVEVIVETSKGWLCATGFKPESQIAISG